MHSFIKKVNYYFFLLINFEILLLESFNNYTKKNQKNFQLIS